jgi:UDP-N-acetylmuramoylalanine--D-glutamate ligase
MSNDKLQKYINGRACTILGLGVSNLPLADIILSSGESLTIIDKKSVSELGDAALELQKRGAKFIQDATFGNIEGELIFRSPGIRPDIDGIKKAQSFGAELTSETELLMKLTDAETFAITGSDGKTTSTTLTGKFLKAEAELCKKGKVYVGGNIGTPLLPLCSKMTSDDFAVLELSSFQLMTFSKAPKYAAITNLSPNHLDWHNNKMSEYEEAKRNIIGKETKRIVLNAESEVTSRIALEQLERAEREVIVFSSKRTSEELSAFTNTIGAKKGLLRLVFERDGVIVISDGKSEKKLLDVSDIILPGRHNVENYMTAIALTFGKVRNEVFSSVAKSFGGVEHRLELVRTLNGVDYYNSSIDSSPSRTAAALSALHGRDIVVICGGYDKQIPFEPLAKSLCESARAVVLTGATGEKIRETILSCPDFDAGKLEVVSMPNFEDAVNTARSLAKVGGCVLLSPACASFDAFKNFAERGKRFCDIVKAFL